MIIRAIDQKIANAGGAHLGEGDFLRAGGYGHPLFKRGLGEQANRSLRNGPRDPSHLREIKPDSTRTS